MWIEGVSKRKQRRLIFTMYDKHNKGAIALNIKKNRQQNIIMGAMYNNGCHNNFLYTTLLPQIQQQRIFRLIHAYQQLTTNKYYNLFWKYLLSFQFFSPVYIFNIQIIYVF